MDHILILKHCNLVSVSLDSDTRPLMIPVCTSLPNPRILRGLGLSSYFKLIQEEEKKTGRREDVLCNDYFSTMRTDTDKRPSPVERVDQVTKG